MNLLFEDMIRVETELLICRIWRQREEYNPQDHKELLERVRFLLKQPDLYLPEMAKEIVEHQSVNSVEIVDRHTGCGVCVHKDWP